MLRQTRPSLLKSVLWFLAFAAFTLLVLTVDVRPIGPEGSSVGLAGVNQLVFQTVGYHPAWYAITDWLGLVVLLFPLAFAGVGLVQLFRRKSLRKVDPNILVLGGFYLLVLLLYLFFETFVVNCRPVLLGGGLEPSYPSSHTMLVICVMATARTQIRLLLPDQKALHRAVDILAGFLMVVTVAGRLLSGVHWLTDIIGSLLLSVGLVALHDGITAQ